MNKTLEKIFNPSPLRKFWKKLFPSKEMRVYNKMYRRHRKELVKHAKETREWDYSWLFDGTIMQIRHMYEYYTAGDNVHQVDESRLEIVEQLKHVLDLSDEMEHLWDDHVGGHIMNEDGSITATDESLESFKQKMNREHELYEEIFAYIGRTIQWWWD